MRYNKLTVFLGAISSLVLMTVVSAMLGWGVTSLIPKIYTFYASVVIMFIFGLKMFWEAYRMKPNEAEAIQHEAEEDLNRRERRGSERSTQAPDQPEQDHEVRSPGTLVQQLTGCFRRGDSVIKLFSSSITLRQTKSVFMCVPGKYFRVSLACE